MTLIIILKTYLITLFIGSSSIWVREMNVTSSVLHNYKDKNTRVINKLMCFFHNISQFGWKSTHSNTLWQYASMLKNQILGFPRTKQEIIWEQIGMIWSFFRGQQSHCDLVFWWLQHPILQQIGTIKGQRLVYMKVRNVLHDSHETCTCYILYTFPFGFPLPNFYKPA